MGTQGRAPGQRLGVASVVLLVLGGAVSCTGGVGGYLFTPTRVVVSDSMKPTYTTGGSIVVNVLAPGVERGDVVLFDSSVWGERGLFLERVVAVGGDRISYQRGDRTLTLNGKPLEEPYVLDGDPVAGSPFAFDVTVPEGRLFLLGDARGNSADSRYRFEKTEGGTAPVSAVKGTVIGTGHPLVVGFRTAVFAGAAVLAAGAVSGFAALRLRRRAGAAAAAAAAQQPAYAGQVPPPGA
ncbi:signal peptidase I [Streptomyces sp. NPDC059193]|uniref:signal peptidase I n=1 Tax=Streptomyces sp. NPDC059193 TaxID=3346763 RepID=UPI0036802612